MRRKDDFVLAVLGAGLLLPLVAVTLAAQDTAVRVWEEPLVIPTYLVGKPERNPMFYGGRAYQGARGTIYPYALLDKLTDTREDKTYKAVYLENKYIKVCVLPEIGGRILAAEDKTNQYNFFYRQHVIKPALIGMLGAWISGGVEWNIPHHHRATSFMPVDYTLEEHPDGSKTVWIGEIELRHRMKWIIGLTLYPDRSYIEATVKLFNRTPFVHSFLYFANVAVHANENYQVIFPPSTEYATYHGKTHFSRWPISTSIYNGVDYTRGVDASWWKNHPSPTSWFCWDCQEDFFGGYDHGRQAGVIHVADHHIVPGKKLWEFANGSEGRMWDKILTETDGPYIELMAGAYSDNQPDYSWIQPHEVKTWKQYWYPIRALGSVKNANLEAAVNLEVDSGQTAKIGLNATTDLWDARVLLQAGKQVLFEQKTVVGPDAPFTKEVLVPQGVKGEDLRVSLLSSDGRELIAYSPRRPKGDPMPEPVKPPPAPSEIKTVEELYLTGLRLEQFYNPALEPAPYYEEALKRDPGNSRVNTILGIAYLKQGRFREAEEKLRTALRRLTKDYTSPKDGEPFYYLGVALEGQGKYEASYDAFYKATWSAAWQGPAYHALAQLACRRGDFAKALEHADHAISANALNAKAMNLKAAVLRHLGRPAEAAQLASLALVIDPLDFLAGNELYLAKSGAGLAEEAREALQAVTAKMRGAAQAYLETAVDYGNCGLWDEAIDILARLEASCAEKSALHPMVYYYLGYFHEQKGSAAEASKYYRLGSKANPDYCFPFRLESIDVLQAALKNHPQDARALYYLGNLLYDRQPAKAIQAWEQSRSLDDTFATVHRNLGLAYARIENNLSKGIASLEKAIACDRNDATLYYELDRLAEQAGVSPEKRLARLESNHEVVLQRDDALQQMIILYVQLGQYDQAIDLLNRRHFHVWEGGGDIHDVYINAHLLRGQYHFKNGRYQEALKDYEAALAYPENLEVGRPEQPTRDAEIYYFIASAYGALGDRTQSRAFYEKSVAQKVDVPEVRYFQGLALRKLGQEAKAARIFGELINAGKAELAATSDMDYFAKFGERRSEAARVAHARYLMGLGYLGQDRRAEAKAEFEKVVARNINHLGARTQLAALR
jgi:tetratricopeptide (TPR) repeat protein